MSCVSATPHSTLHTSHFKSANPLFQFHLPPFPPQSFPRFPMLTDSHVHFFPELLTLEPPFPAWFPKKIHLNATREEDWPAVIQVLDRARNVEGFPEVVPYFGVHPWFAAEVSAGWEKRLAEILERFPSAGIGECGLDALRPEMELQERIFLTQLELAREFRRPITVHCVRAWEQTERLIQRTVGPTGLPILLHGFRGSAEQALHFLQGLEWNVFFSLNSSRIRLNLPKTRRLLELLPPERVLTETDAETWEKWELAVRKY